MRIPAAHFAHAFEPEKIPQEIPANQWQKPGLARLKFPHFHSPQVDDISADYTRNSMREQERKVTEPPGSNSDFL